MKYKLINSVTKIETICDKVTIDGFDYYVTEGPFKKGQTFLSKENIIHTNYGWNYGDKAIICSTNPNIDVPKVVDEVEVMANLYCKEMDRLAEYHDFNSFRYAYNKSQETHPFSDEDMIEFGEWCENLQKDNKEIRRNNPSITTKELLQLWKEQQVKTVYYE